MFLYHKKFLNFWELIFFIVIFSFFLFLAFPDRTLPKFLKNNNSKTAIKYLENLILFYPNNNKLYYLLVKKYIQLGAYKKAESLLLNKKPSWMKYYYEYLIAKRLYFEKKLKKNYVKSKLYILLNFAKNIKQKKFIYKEARSFGFIYIEFTVLKYLNKPKEYVNLLVYLKKYNLALKILKKSLNKHFDEDLFNKLIDIALYKKNLKLAEYYSLKYFYLIKTYKGYESLLRVGILTKNKTLIKYSINKVHNLNLKLEGFLVLKEYNNALKILAEEKNYYLMAQIFFQKKDYKNSLKYFLKDGFKKNIKIITYLAYLLHDYNLLEKILINKIKKGDFNKVNDLVYVFLKSGEIKKGEKVFKNFYKKMKKDIFLKALFQMYYAKKDIKNIKKIVWKFKKLPLNIALYVSDLYISQHNFKKAFEVMLKAYPKTYKYYERLLFIVYHLKNSNDNLKVNILSKILKINKKPEYVMDLFLIYLKQNKLKAFNYLKHNYVPNKELMYQLLKTAYELKKYNFIIHFKPFRKTDFYYVFLIKALKKLNYSNLKVKKIYLQAIKRYPSLKKDYFWFLINTKDKEIANYLNEIKDKHILLGAYLLLHKKYEAIRVLSSLLRQDNNLKEWINYYYLSDSEKIRFKIYRKIEFLIKKNKNLLKNRVILDFYFQASLKYKTSWGIKKLLFFIKQNNLNYKKYEMLYLQYIGAYEKLRALI